MALVHLLWTSQCGQDLEFVQIQSTLAAATDAAEFAAAEVATGTVAGEDKVLRLKGSSSSGSPVVGSRFGSEAGRPTVPQSGRYTIRQQRFMPHKRGEALNSRATPRLADVPEAENDGLSQRAVGPALSQHHCDASAWPAWCVS